MEIEGFKYRLLNNLPALSTEELIFKNLASFPKEDPMEIFGFSLNQEIEEKHESSLKMLNFIRKHYIKTERKRAKTERILKKLMEISIENNELTDFSKEYSKLNAKIKKVFVENSKKMDDFIDFISFVLDFLNEFHADIENNDEKELLFTKLKDFEENSIFKTLIINEYFISNLIKSQLMNDLQLIKTSLLNKNEQFRSNFQEIIEILQNNEIPLKWHIFALRIREDTLEGFLKVFLIKMEHLDKLIYKRKCEIYPIIPLNKLFDPWHFILSYIFQTSYEQKV